MIKLEYDDEKAKDLFVSLKKDPVFGNLSLSELFELLEISAIIQYEPDEFIIRQGESDNQLFILIDGKMEVVHDEKVVGVIDKLGDTVGEMSLISNEKRSASVKSVGHVQCLSIDSDHFKPSKTKPTHVVYYIFSKVLANRLKIVNEEVSILKKEKEAITKV